jgi:hypothetical protein
MHEDLREKRRPLIDVSEIRLLGCEGFGYVVRVWPDFLQMLGHAGTFLGSKHRDRGEDTPQRDGYVVDIVHQANGFSGERHGLGSSYRLIEF